MAKTHTLGEIAALVAGRLLGDAALTISGVNDLTHATAAQISFLGNPRYAQAARNSQAGAILTFAGSDLALPAAQIQVPNPSAAFAKIFALFAPEPIRWEAGIHPLACVDAAARLGEGVYIGPGAVIEAGSELGAGAHIGANVYIGHETKIGAGTFIYPNVTIRERSVIGSRVILHAGVVIGADGFGYEFQQGRHVKVPQLGYVQIDDDVEIGANTTIDRGRFDKTWIQQGCKIDNLVMIAHNVVVGAHSIIVAQCGISGSSTIGKYVTIAGQSAVVGHIKVADQVTVTGWTAVTKDIGKSGIYRGAPAKPMKESMRIEALTMKLPELYERLQALEKKLGADSAPKQS
ncbi:MAG: UDP-3-O-(3-hydroxymyristoyl)glucosamine N-acyltransferase [Verrucomicrobiales bacterium]|jgi:UDP-3-O-[3-hydroxymyristoyl] glucosamine N-acyltransferase|nr:UDP-3-O-(3-hydroxymyristoyl)glucosamine N-acyltransferase [Verrucomicrobiales bacterium]